MNDESVDLLEALVSHPGWRLLATRARAEWDTRERHGRLQALNDTEDTRALNKLRQITAAQEAVEWVLTWPQQELARLKRMDPPPGPVDVLTAMQRRGGL